VLHGDPTDVSADTALPVDASPGQRSYVG